ncbi:hypothetical protein AMJ39_07990 [candidate division TA06 bacterium DG_24]|uniref:Uncharacterized protein n=1 Tax=candidate division TA06 bacterium DG_24 TaxID=1703770 RepID=A0A0S7WQJ8_UNCT6|nr:MAG: hypothetical protein AMJ39_07990 [candidate division TA06 bacterium DG_24]
MDGREDEVSGGERNRWAAGTHEGDACADAWRQIALRTEISDPPRMRRLPDEMLGGDPRREIGFRTGMSHPRREVDRAARSRGRNRAWTPRTSAIPEATRSECASGPERPDSGRTPSALLAFKGHLSLRKVPQNLEKKS